MDNNWIVENLTNAFGVWNSKMTEMWSLLTESPQTFKGGTIWQTIVTINGGMQAMARNLSNTAASLLPYSTIEAAASGNVDAINAVLKHYERYIAALATRTLYDENGVPHLCLDEEKVCRMRTKLITKILDFKVNKTA